MRIVSPNDFDGRQTARLPDPGRSSQDNQFARDWMHTELSHLAAAAVPAFTGPAVARIPALQCLATVRKRCGGEKSFSTRQKNDASNAAFVCLKLEAHPAVGEVYPSNKAQWISSGQKVASWL